MKSCYRPYEIKVFHKINKFHRVSTQSALTERSLLYLIQTSGGIYSPPDMKEDKFDKKG